MAKIILEPSEVFEHFHSETSITTLMEGEASYSLDGAEQTLIIHQPVLTPAMKSHTLKNIGKGLCLLDCGHGNGNKSE